MGYNRAMNRTYNTLFMLMSLDGKISSGANDELDFDLDFPNIKGVSEGLHQYYEIEKTTDWFSFNTGRVMEKVGWNKPKDNIEKVACSFVIVDNEPHLTALGVENLVRKTEKLYIVTTNPHHPADDNPDAIVLRYSEKIDFHHLFQKLKSDYQADRVTIQSGGEMNAVLLREGLIDAVSIVIAPALVGGRETSTLVDGDSLNSVDELSKIRPLKLKKLAYLEDSYVHAEYEIINDRQD